MVDDQKMLALLSLPYLLKMTPIPKRTKARITNQSNHAFNLCLYITHSKYFPGVVFSLYIFLDVVLLLLLLMALE